ncbi:MAG: RAMP superfamily CRISPR-associated protein [Leptolyngbyaceae cyanobacterium bins.349]|nr:RAMP superfamily CRISPR-associated protein [Leptolyngbyaceae cyanobacterium bins.349]
MVFDRPNRPGQAQKKPATSPNPATQRADAGKPKRVTSTGGGSSGGRPRGGNGGDSGSGNGSDRPTPSPWIGHPLDPTPNPDHAASFVEYLRWMRSPDSPYKDPTKVQILQMAEEKANYRDRLMQLTNRTKLIAGEQNTFQAKCLWRIRVGGHRGPESILLPAFDALGMPYIPASTLRGVARTQAIRELMTQENLSWKRAEEFVSRRYFGYLDSKKPEERSGKVIFLDAYPLPQQSGNGGGLAVDMANNIWSWDTAGRNLRYDPNPNPFLSLEAATFLIGIRSTSKGDEETLEKVKQWLSRGLQAGVGSQVNTGYGSLVRAGQADLANEFLRVEFTLEGQLIHGRQKFTQWNWSDRRNEWQMRGAPDAEVRPVAFKSMLRYWFRVFALGVLSSQSVQQLEGNLFGAINPKQSWGWITVKIANGRVVQREARPNIQGKSDPCGEQTGQLILAGSSAIPSDQKTSIEALLKNLTWMMFHLGGVGQGARRPCYSRSSPPWYRGSMLDVDSDEEFWQRPETVQEFQQLFRKRLQKFYAALSHLTGTTIRPQSVREAKSVTQAHEWAEAVDRNCQILVVSEMNNHEKPLALKVLHDLFHELEKSSLTKAKNLCGHSKADRIHTANGVIERKAIPSPIWIADLENYQVVTVFGAIQEPRKRYLNELRQRTSRQNYAQIFPLV